MHVRACVRVCVCACVCVCVCVCFCVFPLADVAHAFESLSLDACVYLFV